MSIVVHHALDIHHASSMMEKITELRTKYALRMKVERYVSDGNGIPESDRTLLKSNTGDHRLIKQTIWRKVMSSGKIFTGIGL